MTGTDRPDLRVVDGGREDSVVRRRRFEEAHPAVVILPPCVGRWRAVVPAGLIPGDGGVAVRRALEDLRGRPDLRLGGPQDRVVAWSWPRRERLAEVAVVGILRWDRQAQPVCESVGEGAVRRGQVLDPLKLVPGLLPRRHRELLALIVGGGLGFGRSQRRVMLVGVTAA